MSDLLQKIGAVKHEEVAAALQRKSLAEMRADAVQFGLLRKALAAAGMTLEATFTETGTGTVEGLRKL